MTIRRTCDCPPRERVPDGDRPGCCYRCGGRMLEQDDWRPRGACYGRHDLAEIFFPSTETEVTVAAAKAICGSCPVVAECREHARRGLELHGVWGGESGQERRNHLGLKTSTEQQQIRRAAKKAVLQHPPG